MVFQNYALYPHLNVFDNIAFGLRLRAMPQEEINGASSGRGRCSGSRQCLQRRPQELSGGQRQRVAMGRAIVRRPAGVPDGRAALEPRREAARPDARGHLEAAAGLGVTTIYVTHDPVEAMTMGDRIAVMQHGRAAAVETPQSLRRARQPVRRRLHRHAADEPCSRSILARAERDGHSLRRGPDATRSQTRRCPATRLHAARRGGRSSWASGATTCTSWATRPDLPTIPGAHSSCSRRSAPETMAYYRVEARAVGRGRRTSIEEAIEIEEELDRAAGVAGTRPNLVASVPSTRGART